MAKIRGAAGNAGAGSSLDELISALDAETTQEGYSGLMERIRLQPGTLEAFCSWNMDHYTRHCLHCNDRYELMLICYEPGQETSIHDYDSQKAWIKPIAGMVHEERFRIRPDGKLELEELRTLTPGGVVFFNSRECIHRHSNPGPQRAITLNLYSRPIRRWNVYDARTGTPLVKGPIPTALSTFTPRNETR